MFEATPIECHSYFPIHIKPHVIYAVGVSHATVDMVIGCVLCPVRAEAEEITSHRAYEATQQNKMAALQYMRLTLGLLQE
jgi:hypothetical protein